MRLTVDHLHRAALAGKPAGELEASGCHVSRECSGYNLLVGLVLAARRVQDVASRVLGVDGSGVAVIGRPV